MKMHDIGSILTELNIDNIYFDSRKVTKNSAFFCVQYAPHYIAEAIDRGAILIVSTAIPSPDYKVRIIVVNDVRQELAKAAAALYPTKPQYIVAVTGTSGKSSVVDYFRQIAGFLGHKAASIGTNGIVCSDASLTKEASDFAIDLTTPDVITMHKILAFLASKGVTHVAFEASSHGIDQGRIGAIGVQAAGFTSFSQDHLDYHNNMEAYKLAKLKLFSENLLAQGTAVIADELMQDEEIGKTLSGDSMLGSSKANVITVGANGLLIPIIDQSNTRSANVEERRAYTYRCAQEIMQRDVVGDRYRIGIKVVASNQTIASQQITFFYKNQEYNISTSIAGSFQATNLLIAAAMLECCSINFDEIVSVLHKVTGVAGRLERITKPDHPWHIFVDYSHKPGALESSLNEMRLLCRNKLYVVFGCGGDRDKTKRKPMGEIAARLADNVIVTDDNPRTEDAASIRKEVLYGCPNAKEVGDRAEAIKYAISQLEQGDILLIAGKGNEDYQIIGTNKIYFDDREEARKYL